VATGRRPEALIVFDRIRRRLGDELGINPGGELRAAHQLAVTDPEIPDASASRDSTETPSLGVYRPAQLPSAVIGFVDRANVNGPLARALTDLNHGGAVVITAIDGMGGIGKTALAVAWAHRIAGQFPDGQLYLNLRGFDVGGQAVEPAEALRSMLQSLEPSPGSVPADQDIDERAARYRSVMADRRMIVLLDNARDSTQVRPLLPAAAGCLVIITSRNRLTGLVAREGARSIAVDRLTDAEARELLVRRLGAAHLAADPDATERVIRACAGLPLALSIAAARSATVPSTSLRHIAHELAAEHRLDALTVGDASDDLRSVLSWSFRAVSTEAQRLFRLLGAHPGPEISILCAASIASDEASHTRSAARELARANLLTEVNTGRFTMHDLLREYAIELLGPGEERLLTEQRLVNHCLHSVHAAYLLYGRPPLVVLEPPGPATHLEQPRDTTTAISWYLQHRQLLDSVVRLAIKNHWYWAAVVISIELRPMTENCLSPAECLDNALEMLSVVAELHEPILEADIQRYVAAKYNRLRDHTNADIHFQLALEQFRAAGDLAGEAHTLRNMANGFATGRSVGRSLEYSDLAVDAATRAGRADVLAVVLNDRVALLIHAGRWLEAVNEGERALASAQSAGMTYLVTITLSRVADAYSKLGDHARAVDFSNQTLATLEENADVDTEIETLTILAQSALAIGDQPQAKQACDRFYALSDSFIGSEARDSYSAELQSLVDAVRARIDGATTT
jgi:tetratricopeptide (TPR) repeat protein